MASKNFSGDTNAPVSLLHRYTTGLGFPQINIEYSYIIGFGLGLGHYRSLKKKKIHTYIVHEF
jgi:hypothetical protein